MSEFRIKPDTAPGTPPPGLLSVYSKTDKKLYIKDDAGAESLVGPGDGITQLTGDVTAGPGYGSQGATVAFVGGASAASIAAVLPTRTPTAISYLVLNTDRIVGVTNTSAPRTITLPLVATVTNGAILIIKDESGGAVTNNIIVVRSGSDTIDGVTSIPITVNYGALRLYSNGVDKWLTI